MKFLSIFKVIIIFLVIALLGITSYIISKNNSKEKNESLTIDTKTKNSYIIQEELNHNNISEEILDSSKCTYEINDNGDVILTECPCDKDCVIIQDEINGYKINKIDEKAFVYNKNLEIIKVPEKIASNIDQIQDFEINDILTTNDEYIVFSTTKNYNDNYLNYIKLSDDEKKECEVIPDKFSNQSDYTNSKMLYSTITNNNLPSSFDLRNYITVGVEDQNPFGLCYAYATLTSVETNIALNHNKIITDFSEIHLALRSNQGGKYGGSFANSYSRYFVKGYGPIYESYYNKNTIVERKTDRDKVIYNFCITGDFTQEKELNQIITDMDNSFITPNYYVLSTREFLGEKEENQELLAQKRKEIKTHIMNYGSIWTAIEPFNDSHYKRNSNGTYVMCSPKLSGNTSWHAVSIIGWDDNFKASNFPSELGVKEDGAWLVLNSWGNNFGNNGCFWVSYQDQYAEAYCYGVVEVHKGKVNIENANITLSKSNFIYGRTERRPSVKFKYNDNEYPSNDNYTISYSNNINAGTGKVIIKGINRFTGTVEKEFTISPKKLSEDKISIQNLEFIYDGNEKKPEVIVENGNNALQKDVDYTLTYANNINSGTGTVTINGIGNYTGEIIKEFTISKKELTPADVTLNVSALIYDGNEKKPEVIIKTGDVALQKDVDYTLTYANNINSGTGTVTINGIGNYTGEIIKEFTISKKELTPADVTLNVSALIYDGNEKKPEVIIKTGDVALQKDVDYTLTYANNINSGTGTVTINGIGNYTGEIIKEFTISKKELTPADVTLNEFELVYDGTEKIPEVVVKNGDVTLQKNVDYTLNYSNNINVGTAKIVITGINNYYGQVNLTFKINKGTPQYNIPTGLTTIFGNTLEDVKLPEGFSWQDELSTAVGNAGKNIFKCTFTPKDQENYNTISDINVVITVIAKIELNTDNYLIETFKDKNQQQILYIENIQQETTLKAFFDNITVNGQTSIYDRKGQEISDNNEIVKTGMKLKASTEFETIEYVLVVTGDLTGNGKADISDLLKLARYLAKLDLSLDGAYYLGANVYRNPNDVFKVDVSDLLKFARVLAKLDEF